MGPGFAVREVLLGRDVRAPELLSKSTVSRGYLLRRVVSVSGLALIDIASLCLAAMAAHRILSSEHGPVRAFAFWHLVVVAAVFGSIFALHQLYGLRARRHRRGRQARAAIWALVATMVLMGFANVWIPLDAVVGWLVAMSLAFAGRELYDYLLAVVFPVDFEAKRTILLGSDEAILAFSGLQRVLSPSRQPVVLGAVGDSAPKARSGIPSLGLVRDIETIVEQMRPDELLVMDREIEVRHLVDLADVCRRHSLTLRLADLEMRFSDSGVSLVPDLEEPLFVSASSHHSGVGWLLKRCGDVVFAALLLIILSPLLAVVAVAIKLSSPGPVLYAAPRVGLGQHAFRCLKFRTMRVGADQQQAALEARNEADGAIFKIKDDPRVTRPGRILRALSIDELPQLINVLRGEMSLVGPRPLPLRDNELLAAWHKQRHVVLPGMTGLWQVRGRSECSFVDMIRFDLSYIESWSVWLDLKILVKTAGTIVGDHGAY